MSSSQEITGGRKSGKAPEKSNFAQTCNRLSQFLKERGSLRELGLGNLQEANGRGEASHFVANTRNLFPTNETPGHETKHGLMDLFPQHAGVDCPTTTHQDTSNSASSSKEVTLQMEPKSAPMTIFYGGKVFVFDNFPADKAAELMLFASKESSSDYTTGFVSGENIKSSDSHSLPNPRTSTPTQKIFKAQPQAIGSDVPIARRASLHRFFEKRKDRVTASAPYQVHGGRPSPSSSKPEEKLALKL